MTFHIINETIGSIKDNMVCTDPIKYSNSRYYHCTLSKEFVIDLPTQSMTLSGNAIHVGSDNSNTQITNFLKFAQIIDVHTTDQKPAIFELLKKKHHVSVSKEMYVNKLLVYSKNPNSHQINLYCANQSDGTIVTPLTDHNNLIVNDLTGLMSGYDALTITFIIRISISKDGEYGPRKYSSSLNVTQIKGISDTPDTLVPIKSIDIQDIDEYDIGINF
jgi:hypothetical protein